MTVSDYEKVECDICCKTVLVENEKDGRFWVTDNGEEIEPWECGQEITISRCESGAFEPSRLTCVKMDICPECYRKMLERWPITDSRFGEKSKYTFTKETEEKE